MTESMIQMKGGVGQLLLCTTTISLVEEPIRDGELNKRLQGGPAGHGIQLLTSN